MRMVRRHLRGGAATWLVCHVLAFSALVPRDCCAAHAHGAAAATPARPPSMIIPAHDMSGTAAHAHHERSRRPRLPTPTVRSARCAAPTARRARCTTARRRPPRCQMTGVCNQPAAALAAVLMQAAVPPAAFALVPRAAQAIVAARAATSSRTRSPSRPIRLRLDSSLATQV